MGNIIEINSLSKTFGEKVELGNMYFILIASVVIAIALYVIINIVLDRKRHK